MVLSFKRHILLAVYHDDYSKYSDTFKDNRYTFRACSSVKMVCNPSEMGASLKEIVCSPWDLICVSATPSF